MKESLYNISKYYKDDLYWIYNTLTTSLIFMSTREYEDVFVNHHYSNDNHDIDELYQLGFLIDEDYDEKKYLRELREDVVNATHKIADMMVAPTMDCNAHCYYCFEHGCHHEKMTTETADALIDYITQNWNHDLFSISWFGGEPLLAPDIIDYITAGLKRNDVNFISRIVTNGSLLSEEIVRKALYEWNTVKTQVTIDAIGEEYNRIKNYTKGFSDNPYELVLSNVEKALTAGLRVRIRINFNPIKQSSAKDLMEYLESQFGKFQNFDSYFAPIDADSSIVPPIAGEFPDREHPWLSLIHFSQRYGYFHGNERGTDGNFLGDSEGILTNLKIYPSPTNCYASCPHVFAVDSKGDLYKCHRVLGKGGAYSSGNIKTGVIKNDIYNFFSDTSLTLKECEDCKLLPICQGGCKINAYIYKDEHACCPARSVMPELIEEYIKIAKEKRVIHI